jgi:hypothetical protein
MSPPVDAGDSPQRRDDAPYIGRRLAPVVAEGEAGASGLVVGPRWQASEAAKRSEFWLGSGSRVSSRGRRNTEFCPALHEEVQSTSRVKSPAVQLGAWGGVEAIDAVRRGTRAADIKSVTLYFKRAKATFRDTARDVAEAVACFANAWGGAVVVGVDDKRSGSAAFVGCGFEAEALRRRIWELTNPSVTGMAGTVGARESAASRSCSPTSAEVVTADPHVSADHDAFGRALVTASARHVLDTRAWLDRAPNIERL